MNLRTTDNNCGKSIVSLADAGEQATKIDYQNLSKIANTTLSELTKNNPSLLVFPKVLGFHDDGIEEEEIFNLHGNPEKIESVTLKTGNMMGFVGIGETQLKIASRFSSIQNDFFLYYLLQKVFSINLFDFDLYSNKGELDLLLFSFPLLLKKALSQGIFRQYQTFARNDANVKGIIDVSRYINQNIPFGGKISYNSRERTFDNSVTELIRHTIEFLKTKPLGKQLLNADSEIKKCVLEIIEATPGYNIREREKLITQNLKPVTHPYFTAYKPLQSLCLSILRHKKLGYGNSKNSAYGILFDGAWLWEEYLATILIPAGFKHPKNKSGTGAIKLYDGNPRYPDFYKGEQIKSFRYGELIPEENFILDAKYKRLENAAISRDDLHQLVTYLHILPAKRGGVIYPVENGNSIIQSRRQQVYGLGGMITSYGFPISQKESYREFIDFIKSHEEEFRKILEKKQA